MAPDYGTVDVHEPGTRGQVVNAPRSAKQTLRSAIDLLNWEREDVEAAAEACNAEARALRVKFQETVLDACTARKERIQRYESAAVVGNADDPVLAEQFAAAISPSNVPGAISLNHPN
jgi:hypothetical protein